MGKSSEFQESLAGERMKNGETWQNDMANALGFDWQSADNDAPLAWPGGPTTAPMTLPSTGALPLPLPENMPDAGGQQSPSLTPMFSAGESAPTAEDCENISNILGELNRTAAKAMLVLTHAVVNPSLGQGEQDLARQTIDQLSRTAEEAEEMALPLSRAVKFHRVTLEGGYCSSNLRALTTQAQDILRLQSCCKMVKAICNNKDK